MNKKIRKIKGFFVGDVEQEGWDWFFRIYYNEKALKKLKNVLNARLRMDEWITMVVDDEGNYKKIVAFSEVDNFEYNLDKVFTKKIIKMFLKQGIEYGLKRHIFIKTDNKMNEKGDLELL